MEADEPGIRKIIIIENPSEAIIAQILYQAGLVEREPSVFIERIEAVGDINYISGSAAAVGSHSRSTDAHLIHLSATAMGEPNLIELARQLEIIRLAMQELPGRARTAEHDNEIGHVAGAQLAARRGDSDGMIAHLRQVGAWTLKIAQDTGAEIVARALSQILGH
jgi:hypothetical protein